MQALHRLARKSLDRKMIGVAAVALTVAATLVVAQRALRRNRKRGEIPPRVLDDLRLAERYERYAG